MDNKQFYLDEHPWICITIILVIYVMTMIVADVLYKIFSTASPVIRVLLKLGLFSTLCFFIIPITLKLPKRNIRFSKYFSTSGLSNIYPTRPLIFIAFSCYTIFVISQLTGTLIYHAAQTDRYIFDFNRHNLLDANRIIYGIFEEVIFRGIILTLLLKHYPERKSILLSAVVFAGIHALNILNPQLQMSWVFSQVIWSVGFGIMYGYIFVKTKSLILLILLHYFINAMVNVWFYGLDKNDFTSAVYGIPFFGLIPAGLAILWVKFLYRHSVIKT